MSAIKEEKINKLNNFVDQNNYIVYTNDFKLQLKTNDITDKIIFNPNKNEVVINLGKKIVIIYNKITTKIVCIFYSEPEYIQSEYILKKPTKYITPYIKYTMSQCVNPSSCLVIGLCLGNMPNSLIGTFGDQIKRIDCVEINSLLCKFYKKYLSISDKIHVYNLSGMDFVQMTKKTYSFVSIDIPCKYITKKFIDFINSITSISLNRKILINIIGEECNHTKLESIFSVFKLISKKKIEANYIYLLE